MTPQRSVSAALFLVGCAASDPSPATPPVFGGKGASIATPDEHPLPAQETTPVDTGPCAKNSPKSDTRLIEDFEDADPKLFKAFEREGWWFMATDNTDGSTVHPSGGFSADALAAGEGSKENHFAAHVQAAGQKQWGLALGTSLQWANKGVRCP
ncbi:MAG TPA: hypothetical protein VGP93_16240, partial [Polyangiaceae bacterium]|nr:hypothetical protein [Polyangiaceae bacterium]